MITPYFDTQVIGDSIGIAETPEHAFDQTWPTEGGCSNGPQCPGIYQ